MVWPGPQPPAASHCFCCVWLSAALSTQSVALHAVLLAASQPASPPLDPLQLSMVHEPRTNAQ